MNPLAAWKRRDFDGWLLLAALAVLCLSFYLTFQQYRTLTRLESELQTRVPPVERQVSSTPLTVQQVFSFPLSNCWTKPVSVAPVTLAHQATTASPYSDVLNLARSQFRNGLLLSLAVVCGLILGVALTYRAASRQLRLANMKSSFISNVSHEMKTPVAVIQMYAETLELDRVKDEARQREYHRVIHNESRKLGQLMEDILDFARMEEGRREYHLAVTDVGTLVECVVEDFEPQAMGQGFDLQVYIERPLPKAGVDPKALTQALLNLLGNAVKYSADAKEIRVTVRHRAGRIAIEVSDRGIGISELDQKRIFDKFYRVNTGLVHNTKGAGLGLAIASHIVKAHNGQITVASRPGEGSTFTILLPPAPQSSSQESHGAPATEASHRRG